MSGLSATAIMWGLTAVSLAAALKPSPQGEPATDEGQAGPGEVEAAPALPRPVALLGVTTCDQCGQRITETDAHRTGGLCAPCLGDLEFEALWGDS